MSDRYLAFANSGVGHWLTGALGLPQPVPLVRDSGRFVASARIVDVGEGRLTALLARDAAALGVRIDDAEGPNVPTDALLVDATGCRTVTDSRALYRVFHDHLRAVQPNGRILICVGDPDDAPDVEAAAIARGMEGFLRSLAKEARRAIAANIIIVPWNAMPTLASTLAFFLSARSAYVSGQAVRVGPAPEAKADRTSRTVLVTGAARGIGAATATSFARAGAHVVALDIPALSDELDAVAAAIGGSALALDITAPDAPAHIAADAATRGGYDVVVHNAGVTRDKTLARMDAQRWTSVMEVNLAAPMRMTEALLGGGHLAAGSRIVGVASLSGIAGNVGQTNYALSKAGVIGWIERLAREVAARGITANAVAPGFIETQMTAAIPFAIREAGRRMNSMGQGGAPEDVAETIAWLADPGSGGINGQVVRVCGQSLLGA